MGNPLQMHWIAGVVRGIVPPPLWRSRLMTQTAEVLSPSRPSYVRLVGVVSAAHFVSHYYIILLAPLMPFVREAYGVSYTEIGLAFTAFNIVSAVGQTPAGFLVDRIGPRALLAARLLTRSPSPLITRLTPSFPIPAPI